MSIFLIFFVIYIILSLLVTWIIYSSLKIYYEDIIVFRKKTKENINLHKEFETYARKDSKINIFTLFLGVITLFWIRFIIFLLFTNLCNFILYYKLQHTEKPNFINNKERPIFKKIINTLTKYYVYLSGIIINYHRFDIDKVNKVYKKYFGPDYVISYEEPFSCYICNHISFCDMMLAMRFLGCGFVAKSSVKNSPILGLMNKNFQSVFVDRGNEKNKKLTLNEIMERQKQFLDHSFPTPIMIFPEGTTTSNRDIIYFKKGAFEALLPIKPMMIKGNEDKDYHIGCGNSNVVINFLRGLCRLYQKIEYIEMPIIKPTKFMYENYKEFGKEKWEIYSKVAREIYCELGGFHRSKNTIRDNFRYSDCLTKKCFIEEDDYQIHDN